MSYWSTSVKRTLGTLALSLLAGLPQQPDQHSPQRPILLAVDQ